MLVTSCRTGHGRWSQRGHGYSPGVLQPIVVSLIAQPDCSQDTGSWCSRIYRLTHNDLLSRYADAVVGTGLRILLIIVLAVLVRLMVHRTINRLTQVTAEGPPPGLLRPLRERAPESWRGTGMLGQRRSQRARTIGSVLRSGMTFVVYGVACTLVLGELGINLGPIIAWPAFSVLRSASARRIW